MTTAVNDITGAIMKTKPPTEEYAKGWDILFGNKRVKLKTVSFTSQASIENNIRACNDTAVVSITGPGSKEAIIPVGFHSILRLQFDDLYEEVLPEEDRDFPDAFPNYPVLWHSLTLPDAHHAKAIIDFLEGLACSKLIVHCHAGISRSAAVALFAAKVYNAEIIGNTNTSMANKRLLRLLDKVYNKEPINYK